MALLDTLTNLAIGSVERGFVSDRLTRTAMRKLCAGRLRSVVEKNESLADFMQRSSTGPIAVLTEKANEQHYEVPAALYQHCLGKRLKYSSCYWPEGVNTLDQAEEAALQETCAHGLIADGQEILELGCGWGSMTLWLLEKYPTARVVAVSNSASQRQYIEGQAHARGYAERLRVITEDMNRFDIEQRFDRVISVEMFEHMRNHRELMRKIAGWLKPDGKLVVHVFCHRKHAYEFNDVDASDWMSRYFFSGGIMPSDDLLPSYNEHLQCEQRWVWNGTHYERTANAWVDNLDRYRDKLIPILGEIYGRKEAAVWFQRWRMLFMAGAELFGFNGGNEWYVGHYRFQHRA